MPLLVETITIVLPVFLVIGLGALLRRINLFGSEYAQASNQLVFMVFLPILLFYKIGQADFFSCFNGPLVLGSCLVICCGFLLSYGYAHLRGYPPATLGSFSQGSFRGNLAYVGLAICFNAYGDEGLTRAGIVMGFLVPVLNLFAILALLLPQHGGPPQKRPNWLAQILFNPLIIASFIGLAWSYWQLPLPVILEGALKIISGITLPLALLAIGAGFSLQRLRGDLVLAGLASSIKLVLLPICALLLLSLLGVQGQDLGIGILLAGTPAATATYVMAHQLKADAELAGSIVMLSTLASAISYTMLLLLLKGAGL